MPEALDYAPATWWARRKRRLVPLIVVVSLSLLALAVPLARHFDAGWRRARARETVLDQRREEIRYRFEERVCKAQRSAKAKESLEARGALLDAEVARDADPALFTSKELAAFDQELAETRKLVEESSRTLQEVISDSVSDSPRTQSTGRWRTLKQLSKISSAAIEDHDYARALEICEQILELDPSDDYARGVSPLLRKILEQKRATTQALPPRQGSTK
jgi:hypothetical protein